MRKIGIKEIEDIATGAALLGAGGGGDPYVGKLRAIGAVRDCGHAARSGRGSGRCARRADCDDGRADRFG